MTHIFCFLNQQENKLMNSSFLELFSGFNEVKRPICYNVNSKLI